MRKKPDYGFCVAYRVLFEVKKGTQQAPFLRLTILSHKFQVGSSLDFGFLIKVFVNSKLK